MPKVRLTARGIPGLLPVDGRLTDYHDETLPGFAVCVTPPGSRSYVLRYRRGHQLRRLTIGAVGVMTLAQARAQAKSALRRVAEGTDPQADKQQARVADTFEELAELYLAEWARPRKKSWREDERLLRNKAIPVLGRITASTITRRDIRALLKPITGRAPGEANNLFRCLHKLFAWAVSEDHLTASPCAGLSLPAPMRRRDGVLAVDELKRLWRALDHEPEEIAGQFRLRLLTAQRPGEVVTMRWDDLDLESSVWTIPASRSKNGLPHRVPLSAPALEILRSLGDGRRSEWVFPGTDARLPISTSQKIFDR